MNRISKERARAIINQFVEGGSIRGISRLTKTNPGTVLKLLREAGVAALGYHDTHVRNLTCRIIEVDEIWSFCYAKQKNVRRLTKRVPGAGDVWLWIAICPETKLIVSWRLGDRTSQTGTPFLLDLQSRLKHRIQLSSDGHDAYLEAVEGSFGRDVDYAREVKSVDAESGFVRTVIQVVSGNPDMNKVGTSYIERFNGIVRTFFKRYARRTLAFSKKPENHAYAVAIGVVYYNFCRVHSSLRVTPAMAAGLTDHVWEIGELLRNLGIDPD